MSKTKNIQSEIELKKKEILSLKLELATSGKNSGKTAKALKNEIVALNKSKKSK